MYHFALYMSKFGQSCQSKKWGETTLGRFHTGEVLEPRFQQAYNTETFSQFPLIWFALLTKPPGNVKELQQHETSTDQRVGEKKPQGRKLNSSTSPLTIKY